MSEEKNDIKLSDTKLLVVEFEMILKQYGMSLAEYCYKRGRSRSWFHTVIRAKHIMPVREIEALKQIIGEDVFIKILKDIKNK